MFLSLLKLLKKRLESQVISGDKKEVAAFPMIVTRLKNIRYFQAW
jgi:hypothetical protein